MGQWITRGFEAFRRGTFGNAGQNLYVSRAGILQRIHLFDFNRDGYVDLLFCNSQEDWDEPPAYVYTRPLTDGARIELPAEGSVTGVVADLNGDGFDDLVLGAVRSGRTMFELNAHVYYGSPAGLSERHCLRLPAPYCTSMAAGDLNGDGKPDLAMLVKTRAEAEPCVRVFYQTELGFEPKQFVDLEIPADQITVADVDGDGFADLYVLPAEGAPRVYWGGLDGIDPDRYSEVDVAAASDRTEAMEAEEVSEEEGGTPVSPLARVVMLGGAAHLFVSLADRVCLVPVGADRQLGPPISLPCVRGLAVAAGDVDGDGHTDLVIAARDRTQGPECSWIYWGDPNGFDAAPRTALTTTRACDVAVGDLSGDGCDDVVICRNETDETVAHHSWSTDSLLFRGGIRRYASASS